MAVSNGKGQTCLQGWKPLRRESLKTFLWQTLSEMFLSPCTNARGYKHCPVPSKNKYLDLSGWMSTLVHLEQLYPKT